MFSCEMLAYIYIYIYVYQYMTPPIPTSCYKKMAKFPVCQSIKVCLSCFVHCAPLLRGAHTLDALKYTYIIYMRHIRIGARIQIVCTPPVDQAGAFAQQRQPEQRAEINTAARQSARCSQDQSERPEPKRRCSVRRLGDNSSYWLCFEWLWIFVGFVVDCRANSTNNCVYIVW